MLQRRIHSFNIVNTGTLDLTFDITIFNQEYQSKYDARSDTVRNIIVTININYI